MGEHSSTPWPEPEYDNSDTSSAEWWRIEGIASFIATETDARFIVHAVNLHDEMVEALRKMDSLLTEDWGDPSDKLTQVRFGHDPCAAWAKIRSALAKASPTPRKVPDPTGSER